MAAARVGKLARKVAGKVAGKPARAQQSPLLDDQLYRLIADSIPQLVWATGPEGDAHYFNSRLLDYTGMSAEQLAGQGWREIICPDDRQHVSEAWAAAARGGERYAIECRLRRADGTYRWHHVAALPLRDTAGRIVRWFGTCTDVENLERMVEERTAALRESERRFNLFMEHVPAIAWIHDSQLRYTYANKFYEKLFGVPASELLGQEPARFFPPAAAARFRETNLKVQREGAPVQYAIDLPQGRWLAVKFPLPDASGGVGVGGIAVDITERSRLEEALRQSERRFQLFMDHLPAYAWIRDARFRYTFVNRTYAKWWGIEPEAMIGRDSAEFFPPEHADYLREQDRKVQRDGAPMQYVDSVPTGRWLKVKFPLPDGTGGVGVAGIAVDITDRTRLEEALAQSEQRFRSFMEHAPAAAWIKDARFRYAYVNRTYESVYGRPAKDVLGRDDFELHGPELARFFREEDETILRTGEAAQRPHKLPYADGRRGQWLVTKFPLGDGAGGTGVAGIAIDATPRFEAEEKARRYADNVRDLVNRLVQAQESERRRVADDLHDLIGQNLTALGIDLQALKQHLQSAGDAAARLDAMAALLETTIDAIRGVMTDLRPVALEEFGLVPALRWYASEFGKRTGMKVLTNASGREPRLPPDTELALFRIVQEALTNAAKHSGGSVVDITVEAQDGGLRVSVEDDGRGFPEPAGARARRGGFGLPTMRERAEGLRGTLRVEFPGRGTRVVVEIPAAPDAD